VARVGYYKIEGGIASTNYSDRARNNIGAIEVCKPASSAQRLEL